MITRAAVYAAGATLRRSSRIQSVCAPAGSPIHQALEATNARSRPMTRERLIADAAMATVMPEARSAVTRSGGVPGMTSDS